MGMPVQDFLGIVKRGWHVVIQPEGSQDPETGSWQIVAARISDAAEPASFIDVTPVDGEVDADQVYHALAYLYRVAQVEQRGDDPQHQLVLAFLASDPSHPPPLPKGLHYAAAPDGSMSIADDRGTELGTIDSGASIARAADAAVGAIATRAAAGLVSKSSKVLSASSEEMSATAAIGNAEIDALVAQLQAMPAERRPLRADPAPEDIARMKAIQTAERQRQLHSDVEDSRIEKGFSKGTLPAAKLDQLCQDNGHRFRYVLGSGKQRDEGYEILDASGALVASGSLKTTVFRPDQNRYLPLAEVSRLLDQIEDAELQNQFKGIAPDAMDELNDSNEEIQKFADEHAQDPDPGDPDGDGRLRRAA